MKLKTLLWSHISAKSLARSNGSDSLRAVIVLIWKRQVPLLRLSAIFWLLNHDLMISFDSRFSFPFGLPIPSFVGHGLRNIPLFHFFHELFHALLLQLCPYAPCSRSQQSTTHGPRSYITGFREFLRVREQSFGMDARKPCTYANRSMTTNRRCSTTTFSQRDYILAVEYCFKDICYEALPTTLLRWPHVYSSRLITTQKPAYLCEYLWSSSIKTPGGVLEIFWSWQLLWSNTPFASLT